MNTKEKILEQALLLFARRGYDAVSVGEIAQAVGIKAPSLYKHYAGKRAILDGIVQKMQADYSSQAAMFHMDGDSPQADAPMFGALDEDGLVRSVLGLFTFFRQDPWNEAFRRMLTVEQFHSPELAQMYTELYCDGPLGYQSRLFQMLGAEEGETLALQFYGPVYLLLTLCDRQPERTEQAERMLERHVRSFYRTMMGGKRE